MNKFTRKIASIITAAAVAVTSLGALPDIPAPAGFVVPVSAADVTEIEVYDWNSLIYNSAAAETVTVDHITTVKLKSCIKVKSPLQVGGRNNIHVDLDLIQGDMMQRKFILDLNGYGIRSDVYDPVFNLFITDFTLNDSNPSRATYYITLTNGRGTAVSSTKPGGTEGTDYLTVTGGYITGGNRGINTLSSESFGTKIPTIFTMTGGTICGNVSDDAGGGVYLNYYCAFTMTGGAIYRNTAIRPGGGVYAANSAKFTMTGGRISDNVTYSSCYVDGTETTDGGGGVCADTTGTFTMVGGTIEDNHEGAVDNKYGNVRVRNGFYLRTGISLDNSCSPTNIRGVTLNCTGDDTLISSGDKLCFDNVAYYIPGSTVTLTVPAYCKLDSFTAATSGGETIETGGEGNTRTFTMPDDEVIVSAKVSYDPSHISVNASGTEYIINSEEGWKFFCDTLLENEKDFFTGKTVKLGADISVSYMAHYYARPFTGTFDGQLHTLTFNNSRNSKYVAPFPFVKNCTIQNLRVSGMIGWSQYSGSIIGQSSGTNTIRGCISNVIMTYTARNVGAFVGVINDGTLTIDSCLFEGGMYSPAESGEVHGKGFVGERVDGTLKVINSVFNPTDLSKTEELDENNIYSPDLDISKDGTK